MKHVPLLQAQSLHFKYHDQFTAVVDVSLELNPGDRLALIGNNGSGKSTLAKLLAGLIKADSGQVLLHGQNTDELPPGRLARSIGFVFQNPDHQIFSPTVREEIAFGPRNLGLVGNELEERVEDILWNFELNQVADRPPASLSYGLRRVVSVASVAAMQTPIIILDEPSLGLDWRRASSLMEQVLTLEPQVLLLISHDLELVTRYTDQTAVIDGGQIRSRASTSSVMKDEALLAQLGFEPPLAFRLINGLAHADIPKEIVDVGSLSQWVANLVAERGP